MHLFLNIMKELYVKKVLKILLRITTKNIKKSLIFYLILIIYLYTSNYAIKIDIIKYLYQSTEKQIMNKKMNFLYKTNLKIIL